MTSGLRKYRPFGQLFLIPAVFIFGSACDSKGNKDGAYLVITSGAQVALKEGKGSFDFGKVPTRTSKSQVFTVTNLGKKDAQLGDVGTNPFLLDAPFTAETPTSENGIPVCTSKMTLTAKVGACLFAVKIAPTVAGKFDSELFLNYQNYAAPDAKKVPESKSTSIGILGEGFIDPTDAPLVIITSGAKIGQSSTVDTFDFGTVNILQSKVQLFTITNIGRRDAKLGTITSAGFSITDPFEVIATNATNGIPACTDSMILATGGGACVFQVELTPPIERDYSATLKMGYVEDPDATATPAKTATLKIFGHGKLDCSEGGENGILTVARKEGVQAAKDKMALDAIRGTADGVALTKPQGYDAGYSAGYSSGYSRGYNGSEGYSKGYSQGKADGERAGLVDPASCNQGQAAGHTKGWDDGLVDGKFDGYQDGYASGTVVGGSAGYDDGYDAGLHEGEVAGSASGSTEGASTGRADGYENGYDVGDREGYDQGYTDGLSACTNNGSSNGSNSGTNSGSSDGSNNGSNDGASDSGDDDWNYYRAPRFHAALDPAAYVESCYNQGYDATYSTSAYWNAYNKAKAENVEYQAGVREGTPVGDAEGLRVGKIDGYNKGHDDGYAAGFEIGADAFFAQCYNTGYDSAYVDGYNQGYRVAFEEGGKDGIDDAYQAEYQRGRNIAYPIGFENTHDDAFSAEYTASYETGFNDGYLTGFDSGYYDGYDAGALVSCGGFSMKSMASAKANADRKKDRLDIKVPKPTIPKMQSGKKRISKPGAKTPTLPVKRKYGANQKWWKESKGHGVSHYIPSATTAAHRSTQSLVRSNAMAKLRDLARADSFRKFLLDSNSHRRFIKKGLRTPNR